MSLSAEEERALRSELILAYCTIEEQRAQIDRLRGVAARLAVVKWTQPKGL